jgi:hypothetical protein
MGLMERKKQQTVQPIQKPLSNQGGCPAMGHGKRRSLPAAQGARTLFFGLLLCFLIPAGRMGVPLVELIISIFLYLI